MPNSPKKPEPTFEEALEHLETIVEDLEGGRMPLEELVTNYGKGTQLLKRCQESLAEARQRVESIDPASARKGNAKLTIMDEADGTTASSPPIETDDNGEQLF